MAVVLILVANEASLIKSEVMIISALSVNFSIFFMKYLSINLFNATKLVIFLISLYFVIVDSRILLN